MMSAGFANKASSPAVPDQPGQWRDLMLVSLTVILFYLAFPGGAYPFLAWIAIVPVIVAIHDKPARYAFLLGLLAATLGWMASIWWVVEGLVSITISQINIVIPLVFLFCLIAALPYALATLLHSHYRWGESLSGAIKSAAVFTLLVNYIPNLLPGNLAHSLYLSPQQIQLADIGGVPLVFFILHCVNLLVANAITFSRQRPGRSIKCLLLAFGIWAANWAYGDYTSEKIGRWLDSQAQDMITVAMLQPNLSISLRERQDWITHSAPVLDLLEQLASKPGVDLLVLPEMPVPVSYREFARDRQMFDSVIKDKSILIAGIHGTGEDFDPQGSYFNTLELIQTQQLTHQYYKQKLLPFAEYLPFETQLPFLRTLFPNAPRYQAGEQALLMDLRLDASVVKLIPLICYEAVFTELVGRSVAAGGQLLVNSVNDAWFGNTAGRQVHFALSMFRSVEYRMPLIRVTNNGISAVISASGEIVAESVIAPFRSASSVTQIPLLEIRTFYQDYPAFFMLMCVFISGWALISGRGKTDE